MLKAVKLSQVAEDKKKGLTLAQVAEFVQETYKADVDPDIIVECRVGWRSQIIELSVGGYATKTRADEPSPEY